MSACPCGSLRNYQHCCAPFLCAKVYPKTAEELMRSRYTAYTLADMDYIKKTMQGKALARFDEPSAKTWSTQVQWLGLQVLKSWQETPNKAFVVFIASYREAGVVQHIHETSLFLREGNRWVYVDGVHQVDGAASA